MRLSSFKKKWGRLPFSKILLFLFLFVFGCAIFLWLPSIFNLRSSSFKKNEIVFHFQNIEVVFHISFSWVGLRLHTKNQLPRLPRSCLKCNHIRCGGVVVWWWCGGFFTVYNTTPTKSVGDLLLTKSFGCKQSHMYMFYKLLSLFKVICCKKRRHMIWKDELVTMFKVIR